MSGEKNLEQLKKEAAEKAKELVKQRLAEKQASKSESTVDQNQEANTAPEGNIDIAKAKAAAAAKAKAAAMAKLKAKEEVLSETATAENDGDLAKAKAAAAAKAKAAALAKAKAKAENTASEPAEEADLDTAKQKAAAAAKAKAAAAAKAKAAALAKQSDESALLDEKAKAVAAAKAKAAAAAKVKAAAQGSSVAGDDEKAKAIAAAKAKAAAAAKAKVAGATGGSDSPAVEEKKPSVNQPYLDKYVKVIEEHLGKDVLEDYYINNLSKDVPTLVAKAETYYKVAEFLKFNELLGFDYLSEIHGSDFETHMEVYAHLYSYKNRQSVALKVKIDRDEPTIDSVVPLWAGANWPECEAYDLLGIRFKGHPDLYRIMLGEDWVGHPLRKDYEPYDVEV